MPEMPDFIRGLIGAAHPERRPVAPMPAPVLAAPVVVGSEVALTWTMAATTQPIVEYRIHLA